MINVSLYLKSLCLSGIILFINPSNSVVAPQLQQGMNTGIGGVSQVLDYYYAGLTTDTLVDNNTDSVQDELIMKTSISTTYDATKGELIQGACTGKELVNYACRFIGNPYKWGGTSLTKGADCSGFVQSVYEHYGVSLDRVSKEQAMTSGKNVKVSLSSLKPGDLIFYAKSSTVNHVAIYIGEGKIVHAAGRKYGITISDYDYRKPFRARRVISN